MPNNETLLETLNRMCNRYPTCAGCPLDKTKCDRVKEGMKLIEDWGNNNPRKTYLNVLLEKFPNTILDNEGVPNTFCPSDLGLKDIQEDCSMAADCKQCWSQLYEEGK